MNKNFFVRLAFATHRVADALGATEDIAEEIREAANAVLADLVLLTERDLLESKQRQELIPRLERQIDVLIVYLKKAEQDGGVNPQNFEMLQTEYTRIREFLEIFEDLQPVFKEPERKEQPQVKQAKPARQPVLEQPRKAAPARPGVLTARQEKILEFLKTKENAQVWELQKVLPEVTKRTLRRDLDELLQKDLVERKGEWNTVFYELK